MCGCPVVASNASCLPEILGDAGYFIDPYDTEAIAEGIYKVLNNNSLRQDLISRGYERVKLFSWEKAALKVLEAIREVYDRREALL